MWMCFSSLNSFRDNQGHHTYVSHSVHESTARYLNPLIDDRQNTVNSCGCSVLLYTHVHVHVFLQVYVSRWCTISAKARVSQQVQTANTLTCLTHSAPEPLMGALYCSWLVPAPKTSSRAAAAVRTQTKPPFTSSAQLFIFRGIRGNTRQGLSDPNSRTSLLFYTQASSQLSLIFSNCFLSCLVE